MIFLYDFFSLEFRRGESVQICLLQLSMGGGVEIYKVYSYQYCFSQGLKHNVGRSSSAIRCVSTGGTEPGYENNYNRDNPFAFDKFEQEAIVGIVGGFYGLVLLVCCGVVIYWYRTFNGLNKEWETHQLATLKTGLYFIDFILCTLICSQVGFRLRFFQR